MDLKQMNESRKEGKYVDFTIFVEDRAFPVHRVVLDTGSEYFKLLFTTDMKENQDQCCHMQDVTAVAVERVLDFLYGEELVLDDDAITDVLKVCHMWQVATAVEKCENFLIEKLSWGNFILTIKIAKLYGLKELRKKCSKFIVANVDEMQIRSAAAILEEDEMLEILAAAEDTTISMSDLWDACIEWVKLQKGNGSPLCVLMQNIPLQKFHISEFLDTIHKDSHVESCDTCKEHVRRQISSLRARDLTEQNAIAVKRIAKKFHCEEAEQLADAYIVEYHKDVLASPAVVNLDETDLIKYVKVINDGCSSEELNGLIRWMKHSPEREGTFKKLFDEKMMRSDSQFLKDVREIAAILKPEDFFYMARLADKYKIVVVYSGLSRFLRTNLHRIVELPEFNELTLERLIKYLEVANISQKRHNIACSQQAFWDAAMRWVKHNLPERRRHFRDLLKVLPMEDFSLTFIKEKVLKCGLFSESDVLLTNIVLNKVTKEPSSKPQAFVLVRRPRS